MNGLDKEVYRLESQKRRKERRLTPPLRDWTLNVPHNGLPCDKSYLEFHRTTSLIVRWNKILFDWETILLT